MRQEPSIQSKVVVEFASRAGDGPAYAGFFRALIKSDVKSQARQITQPTLVLHAQDDRTIPLAAGSKLAALIPGARFEIITGGHGASSGASVEAHEIILEFIEAHP